MEPRGPERPLRSASTSRTSLFVCTVLIWGILADASGPPPGNGQASQHSFHSAQHQDHQPTPPRQGTSYSAFPGQQTPVSPQYGGYPSQQYQREPPPGAVQAGHGPPMGQYGPPPQYPQQGAPPNPGMNAPFARGPQGPGPQRRPWGFLSGIFDDSAGQGGGMGTNRGPPSGMVPPQQQSQPQHPYRGMPPHQPTPEQPPRGPNAPLRGVGQTQFPPSWDQGYGTPAATSPPPAQRTQPPLASSSLGSAPAPPYAYPQHPHQAPLQQQHQPHQFGGAPLPEGVVGAGGTPFLPSPVQLQVHSGLAMDSMTPDEAEAMQRDAPSIALEEGSIIITFRPQEFKAKRAKVAHQGPENALFVADFDALVKFHRCPPKPVGEEGEAKPTSTVKVSKERTTLNTVDLVLASGFLGAETAKKVRGIRNSTAGASMAKVLGAVSAAFETVQVTGSALRATILPAAPLASSLRDGTEDFVKAMARHQIPAFLFCTGIKDVALQVLLAQMPAAKHATEGTDLATLLPPNIQLVSNSFKVAPDGRIQGIRGFSGGAKNDGGAAGGGAEESMSSSTPPRVVDKKSMNMTMVMGDAASAGLVRGRKNAVVLGDHPSSSHLADGLPDLDTTIRVGFAELGADVGAKVEQFRKLGFDVLVLGDGSLETANELVRDIAARLLREEQRDGDSATVMELAQLDAQRAQQQSEQLQTAFAPFSAF